LGNFHSHDFFFLISNLYTQLLVLYLKKYRGIFLHSILVFFLFNIVQYGAFPYFVTQILSLDQEFSGSRNWRRRDISNTAYNNCNISRPPPFQIVDIMIPYGIRRLPKHFLALIQSTLLRYLWKHTKISFMLLKLLFLKNKRMTAKIFHT